MQEARRIKTHDDMVTALGLAIQIGAGPTSGVIRADW